MYEAMKFVDEVNEMKVLIVEQMAHDEILNIDEKSLKAIQTAIRLVDAYRDFTLEQAKLIEETNKKLDMLLVKMDALMSK